MQEINLEEENEDARNRQEVLSKLEPDMELIEDIEAKSLQKILYFYHHSRRSQGRKYALENFIIEEDKTEMITKSNQRIRNATLTAKFQKEIRDIKEVVDTFCSTFNNLSYEDFIREYIIQFLLPYDIIKTRRYQNIENQLIIEPKTEDNIIEDNDDSYIELFINQMKEIVNKIKRGMKWVGIFGIKPDENLKVKVLSNWNQMLYDSMNSFADKTIQREKFDEPFEEISAMFFTQKN